MTLIRVFEELRALGYEGGYDAVRRYARAWSQERTSETASAYVPLSFAPGEAYQFDWSHDIVVMDERSAKAPCGASWVVWVGPRPFLSTGVGRSILNSAAAEFRSTKVEKEHFRGLVLLLINWGSARRRGRCPRVRETGAAMNSNFRTFRDHTLSIYQSAAASVERKRRAATANRSIRVQTFDHSGGEGLLAAATDVAARRQRSGSTPRFETFGTLSTSRRCAEIGLRYLEAKLAQDTSTLKELDAQFRTSACDPAWASTLTEYLKFFGPGGGRAQIPYIDASAIGSKIIRIKSGAKIALVADWGTGTAPAQSILKQIQKLEPDIIIHLGDVYYSGTPEEYEANFAQPIKAVFGETDRIPVFALAGNHDMYSGGSGFYNTISTFNEAEFAQRGSFFAYVRRMNLGKF